MGAQWAVEELSVTAFQLLANLGAIRDNLNALGRDRAVKLVDRYLTYLNEKQPGVWEFIDYVTACISRVYGLTPERDRAYVFKDYRPAKTPLPGRAYAPKAEVRHFCEQIEPLILASQRAVDLKSTTE